MAIHVHEFLYRGAIPEENRGNAFHVVVAAAVEAFGKTERILRGPMSLDVAEKEFGLSLAGILGEVAAQAVVAHDAASAAKAAADAERDEAKAAADQASKELEAALQAGAAIIAQRDAALAEIARLQGGPEPATEPEKPSLLSKIGALFQ